VQQQGKKECSICYYDPNEGKGQFLSKVCGKGGKEDPARPNGGGKVANFSSLVIEENCHRGGKEKVLA